MNRIKSVNLRCHKRGLVHMLNSETRTLCGCLVENSYYSRWHPTEDEITCSHCLRTLARRGIEVNV